MTGKSGWDQSVLLALNDFGQLAFDAGQGPALKIHHYGYEKGPAYLTIAESSVSALKVTKEWIARPSVDSSLVIQQIPETAIKKVSARK